MSQDGSSSKSYIKHPTEKARLDNLAFTTFPEDYLPYTSSSYHRKAPYLVWDHHNYDGGGGLFRSRRRRLRRCCCGATALASTVSLLIAAILAIIAVSVYLGVVTNLFRSPIFSLSGRFKVVEGDVFEEALLNQTSYEFLAKAEYYRSLVENAFTSSTLAPAFVASRIVAFRSGSLLVFFRIHLDRRKLDEDDDQVTKAAKNVLAAQAIAAPSASFDNLILDFSSIDVREYADEEWLMSSQFYFDHEQPVDLNPDDNGEDILSNSKVLKTVTPSSKIDDSTKAETIRTTVKPESSSVTESSSIRTKVTKAPANNKASGPIGHGYAEWKPIDLPEAIQVASLDISPRPPRTEVRASLSLPSSNRGSSRVELHPAPRENAHVINKPPSNVASSITSSVSLVIRPSSKNKTTETGIGIVETVPLDDDDIFPILERKGLSDDESPLTLEHKYRKDTASLRLLELGEDETISNQPQSADDLLKDNVNLETIKGNTKNKTIENVRLNNDSIESIDIEIDETQQTVTPNEITSGVQEEFEFISSDIPNSITNLNEDGHEHEQFDKTTTEAIVVESELSNKESASSGRGDGIEALSSDDELISVNAESHSTSHQELPYNISIENDEIYTVTDFHNLVSTIESFDISYPLPETSGKLFDEDVVDTTGGSDYDTSMEELIIPTLSVTSDSVLDAKQTGSETLNSNPTKTEDDYPEIKAERTTEPSLPELASTSTNTAYTTSPPSTIFKISESPFDQDLQRFRKIVQPLKDNRFNPNDIPEKDGIKDVYSKVSPLPALRITLPVDNKSQEKSDDNAEKPVPTSLASTTYEDFNTSSIVCLDTEMVCDNGECVPLDYRCNMRRDCEDNSDEDYCTCADYLSVIGQSQKICDGVRDCWDLSDEENCPWCSPGQFLCPQSKFCVNVSQICDGSSDCPFGTDERYCVKLADDDERAKRLDYYSHGYLMVRKNGQWGKLCFEDFNVSTDSSLAQMKLEELGKAVCNALTYRELKEAVQLTDNKKFNQSYYEIKGHVHGEKNHQSSAMFQPSSCQSREVVHVKCKSLECGLRPMAVSSRRRIVGGQSTGSGSWPWQVALYKEGDFQCGAVLVSDNWLISAGHCFFSTQSAYWTARMGILRRGTELKSPSEQIRRIVKIILHPEYIDKGFINDIALLKLERPVRFSDFLRPLCLPKETEDVKLWDGQYCSVVGWGKLYEIGHTFPDSLQEVRLPVISTEECRKRIIFLSMYHITDNMFCAGYTEGGRDACLGDSGGPLMCQRQDGRFVLLGVTSNGDGCGRPGRPGVYTKVTQYLPWIHKLMSEDNFDDTSEYNSTDPCSGHRCELGRCVQDYKVCDGRYDCIDGSDEKDCTP